MIFYISALLMLLSLSDFIPFDYSDNPFLIAGLIVGAILRISNWHYTITWNNRRFIIPM